MWSIQNDRVKQNTKYDSTGSSNFFFFPLSNSSLLSVWARNFPESLLFISGTKPADNPSITSPLLHQWPVTNNDNSPYYYKVRCSES